MKLSLGHFFHLHISVTLAPVVSHMAFIPNSNLAVCFFFPLHSGVATMLEEHFGLAQVLPR